MKQKNHFSSLPNCKVSCVSALKAILESQNKDWTRQHILSHVQSKPLSAPKRSRLRQHWKKPKPNFNDDKQRYDQSGRSKLYRFSQNLKTIKEIFFCAIDLLDISIDQWNFHEKLYNYPTDPSSVAGKLRGSISEEPSAHKLRAYCPSTGLMGHHPATSHATVHLRHQWGMRWCIWSLDIVSCRVLSWEPNALDTPLNLFQHTGTPCFPFTWKSYLLGWRRAGILISSSREYCFKYLKKK